MNQLHSIWVIALCLFCTSIAHSQCFSGSPSVDFNSWNFSISIDANYNAARRFEETNIGLTPGCLGNMNAPPGGWGAQTLQEMVFYIHNSEREARGILPLHGVEDHLTSVAQGHSNWQITNDVFAHGGDPSIGTAESYAQCANCNTSISGSSPSQRMNQSAPLAGQWESESENISILVSSGGFINYFAAIGMYDFMYRDLSWFWGHRLNVLRSYTNNWGAAGTEGFIGVGVTFGTDYQICGFNCETWNFAHILTVDYYDPEASAVGYTFSTVSAAAALPVELLSFTANNQEEQVFLNWSTANENNSDYFELQRSSDGRHFETITVVRAAGDSTEKRYYSYVDKTPGLGVQYYRLNEVDFDRQSQLSDVVSVFILKQFSFNVYPNPFSESFVVKIQDQGQKPLSFTILNNIGEQVLDGIWANSQQEVFQRIYMGNLPAGMYTLLVSKNDSYYTKRVIKN